MSGRVATSALVAAVVALLLATPSGSQPTQRGGTFRMAIWGPNFDSIDPVVSNFGGPQTLLRATCGGLMRHPDKPLPAGLTLVPEIASAPPRITNDGKTYTFTIRRGLRFSTGAPVTARSFEHTVNRLLSPIMQSSGAGELDDVVGARAVIERRAARASGVVARGDRLTIRLTKPSGDLTARVGTLCVVPETTPIHPEGVSAPAAAAGPYYIAEYVPGRKVTLLRNRFYRGDRPHRVSRFEVDLPLHAPTILERVERGELDYGWIPNQQYGGRAEELLARYGINRSRFFAVPANNLRMFVLNTRRPLFRNNVKLRQAVNFAVDRRALLHERGPLAGYLTDQFLMPGTPSFQKASIYPLKAPNVARARELARGRTREGKAVLYVPANEVGLAQAQILRHNLKAIGLDVEIVALPFPVMVERMRTPGESFDIGWIGWLGAPQHTFLNWLFDGRTIADAPNFGNWSYFDSPRYNRLLEEASQLPIGPERYRRYGELDVDIARNAAPAIAFAYDRTLTLVSARTGCVVVNPELDLAAVCLKR